MKATNFQPGLIAQLGFVRILTSAAVFSISLGTLFTGITGAIFTDSESVGGNAFTAGTVDISADPASAVVALPAMAPGDQVTAPLTVSNDGSLQLRYALESTTTEDVLAAQLAMTVKIDVSDCTDGGFGADGTILYGPAALGSIAGVTILSNRVLAASGSEELCLQVSLPIGTGNAYQGLSTTASFNFEAEQTANN